MIGKTISHYKILDKLGGGGMGVVYKAQDTKLDRTVALKFLPPHMLLDEEAEKRFIAEAKAASSFDHPNICTIYEIDKTDDDQLFIAMTCYEGETLKKKLEKGPIKIEEAIDIVSQIAEGLEKAHEKSIIHRDIKPANIFFTNEGVVKILDFGLAKVSSQTQLTQMGSTIGTIAYMSPEQSRGEVVDHRTDIWSLGVILYEMITGQQPFKGDYEQAVIYSILNEEPESAQKHNSEISSELLHLLNLTMDKDPSNRYQSMEEIITDLRRFNLDSDSHKSLKEVQGEIGLRVFTFLKQRKWISVFIIATVLIIIGWFALQKLYYPEVSDSAISEKSIAVMYFEDNTGDEDTKWLSRGLPHMLITSLEQVPELQVVGYQRLYDILKQLNKGKNVVIDKSTATEIAQKAGVANMLLGSIIKWRNRVRVDYQLQDVNKGTLIYANKVDGEDPFGIADELAQQVSQKLKVSKMEKGIRKIAEVTTKSIEAYRAYIKAYELRNHGIWKEAWGHYKDAINHDSTFAIAYLEMAMMTSEVGLTEDVSDSLFAKAVKYSSKTSERERFFILGQKAKYYGLRNEYRNIMEELVNKYPNYSEPFMELGWLYYERRNYTLALKYMKRAAELAEYSGIPMLWMTQIYDDIGDYNSSDVLIEKYGNATDKMMHEITSNFRKNDFDNALKSAKKLTEEYPFQPWAHRLLGMAYFNKDQFNEAEEEFKKVDSLGFIGNDVYLISSVRVYQGKYKKMIEYCENRKETQNVEIIQEVLVNEIGFYELHNQFGKVKEIWENLKPLRQKSKLKKTSELYAADSLINLSDDVLYSGNFGKTLQYYNLIQKEIITNNLGEGFNFSLLQWRADLYYYKKEYQKSIKLYKNILEEEPEVYYYYRLAECYFYKNEFMKCKEVLINIKKNLRRNQNKIDLSYGYAYPRKYYLLGKVNEALGEKTEAIEAYKQFLEIWKQADDNLPELIDAKNKLELLTKVE